jgi:hypothetical protein
MDDSNLAGKKRAHEMVFRTCTFVRYGEMSGGPFSGADTLVRIEFQKYLLKYFGIII